MNHNDAIQFNACEKYLLGELSGDLREAFEEHYFSCAECALQLRSAADFLAASRQILSGASSHAVQPQPATAPSVAERPDYVRVPRGWFPWMNPWVAGPAFAALLLFIGYQNFVTIPHYRQGAAPRVLPMYSLISSNTRSDRGLTFSVSPSQPFGLYVDVPVDPAYSTYLLRLENPTGSSALLRSLTADEAKTTQVVTVNPGTQAGNYVIVVSGLANPSADISSAKELARLRFSVELKN